MNAGSSEAKTVLQVAEQIKVTDFYRACLLYCLVVSFPLSWNQLQPPTRSLLGLSTSSLMGSDLVSKL